LAKSKIYRWPQRKEAPKNNFISLEYGIPEPASGRSSREGEHSAKIPRDYLPTKVQRAMQLKPTRDTEEMAKSFDRRRILVMAVAATVMPMDGHAQTPGGNPLPPAVAPAGPPRTPPPP
jgi:hypothetical protein